jgi:hypothetical protein
MPGKLAMSTVSNSPADHPGLYVVRRFIVAGGESVADPDPCFIGGSLAAARDAIPPDVGACPRRGPSDEP